MRVTIDGLLEALTSVLLVVSGAGFLGRVWWALELASHFRPHLAASLALLCPIWLARRHRRLAVGCALFAVINALPVLALLWPAAAAGAGATAPLRVVAINVETSNRRADLVLDFLHRADADVILLMEVDDRWLAALAPLRAAYPHVLAEPRDDNFGIVLFSRLPTTNSNVIALGDAAVPSIEATVTAGGRQIHLLGTHALPPGTPEYARLRNDQFRQIAAHVRRQTLPTVVVGDLNATPWSPYFADLLRESGLKNSSQGLGLFGSWPAWLPLGRLPLDHCLISASIQTSGKRVGPQVGSDHLPVVVELDVNPNGSRAPGRRQPGT